ncbi:MAG: hypothetical protein K8S18_02530, partial [Desulfobacula sp.]|nr:hypothetical protein [Desulfobacula sp.]
MLLLGEALINEGKVTRQQLAFALQEQKRTKELLGEVLIRSGILSEKELSRIIAIASDISYVDLKQTQVDTDAVQVIESSVARRFVLIPFALLNDVLCVAMDNPNDVKATDELTKVTGMVVDVFASDK